MFLGEVVRQGGREVARGGGGFAEREMWVRWVAGGRGLRREGQMFLGEVGRSSGREVA